MLDPQPSAEGDEVTPVAGPDGGWDAGGSRKRQETSTASHRHLRPPPPCNEADELQSPGAPAQAGGRLNVLESTTTPGLSHLLNHLGKSIPLLSSFRLKAPKYGKKVAEVCT